MICIFKALKHCVLFHLKVLSRCQTTRQRETVPSKGKLRVTSGILILCNNDGCFSLLTQSRMTLGDSLAERGMVYIKVTSGHGWGEGVDYLSCPEKMPLPGFKSIERGLRVCMCPFLPLSALTTGVTSCFKVLLP